MLNQSAKLLISNSAAIAMWFDTQAAAYGLIAAEINHRFAEQLGFRFFIGHCSHQSDRSAEWQKVGFLLELLRVGGFQTLIWLDADAVLIEEHADSLFRLLHEHSEEDLLLSRDKWGSGINSGVMILRRTPITRAVLRTLYWVGSQANRTTDGAYCASFLHKRWYEQSCLQRLWDANHAGVQAHAALVPYGVLQRASDGRGNLSGRSRFWQTPVLHAMGRGDVDRVKTLCNLCVFAVTLCASVARSGRRLPV